jgi:hypothetical protein
VKHLRPTNEALAGKKSIQKNGISMRESALVEKFHAPGSTLRLLQNSPSTRKKATEK